VAGAAILNLGAYVATLGAAMAGAALVGRVLTGATTSELTPLIWVVVVLALPIPVLGWAEDVVTHTMSFELLGELRKLLYERFRLLAPAYFLRRRSGDVARVAMADVELLELFTSHMVPPLMVAMVVPIGAAAVLFAIHWGLGLIVLPLVILAATVPSWLLRRAQDQGERLREEHGAVGADIVDSVQGTRDILASGAQEAKLDGIRRSHRAILGASVSHGWRSGIEQAATDGLAALAGIAAIGVAAFLASNGEIPTSQLPLVVILAGGAFLPLAALTGVMRDVGQVSSAARRVQELLAAQPEVSDLTAASPADPIVPRVEFRQVRFRYGPSLPEVLHGLDLTIEPGETLALVGPSGAGKSTCANLLLRLWDVEAGSVSVGGHDVRNFTQRDLRAHMSVVPQDVFLFHTSVFENVRLGRPDAPAQEVERAAELALATEFIEALPDGWRTVVGERGTTLSGGQRQRIAIARALLRDAPILIMDEAVANLDAESAEAIHAALAGAARRPTTLLIAHRPSTIRIADRVAVLSEGRVVEQGTYAELTAGGGALSRLLATSPDVIDASLE
jgi:ATP-binding cassette, subfamily C, bacterial CydC